MSACAAHTTAYSTHLLKNNMVTTFKSTCLQRTMGCLWSHSLVIFTEALNEVGLGVFWVQEEHGPVKDPAVIHSNTSTRWMEGVKVSQEAGVKVRCFCGMGDGRHSDTSRLQKKKQNFGMPDLNFLKFNASTESVHIKAGSCSYKAL